MVLFRGAQALPNSSFFELNLTPLGSLVHVSAEFDVPHVVSIVPPDALGRAWAAWQAGDAKRTLARDRSQAAQTDVNAERVERSARGPGAWRAGLVRHAVFLPGARLHDGAGMGEGCGGCGAGFGPRDSSAMLGRGTNSASLSTCHGTTTP